MINKKQYVSYETYLRADQNISNFKRNGATMLFKRNKVKIAVGLSFLVIGILPNGLAPVFMPLGFMCLGIKKVDLYLYKEKGLRIVKNKIRELKR